MRVFSEKQWFNQWWMLFINGSLLILLGVFCYRWFVLEEAVDKVAQVDVLSQILVIVLLLLCFGLPFLFKLHTTIDEKGVQLRFAPFHRKAKRYSWYDISKCYTRKYRPISEYGGWGIRFFPNRNDIAYNVKGSMGIQLELKNGKKILIGTQRPEAADQIIKKYHDNERV